jgi:hypothetical protein
VDYVSRDRRARQIAMVPPQNFGEMLRETRRIQSDDGKFRRGLHSRLAAPVDAGVDGVHGTQLRPCG